MQNRSQVRAEFSGVILVVIRHDWQAKFAVPHN